MFEVTDVKVNRIEPQGSLIAFVSVILNGSLVLNSIGVHSKLNSFGYRLTYPTKKSYSSDLTLFHPINQETSRLIETAIFSKLKDVSNEAAYIR